MVSEWAARLNVDGSLTALEHLERDARVSLEPTADIILLLVDILRAERARREAAEWLVTDYWNEHAHRVAGDAVCKCDFCLRAEEIFALRRAKRVR